MKILIVDEGADMGAGTSEVLENLGHIVKERASAQDGLDALMEEPFHLLLLGLREVNGKTMALIEEFVARSPRLEVVVCSPSSSVREELEARRKGAAGFLPAPVSRRSVERLVQRMEEARRTAHRLAELEDRLERDAPPVRFETDDPRMREVLETVAAVATTPTTVLLLGESGTGKSLLARAIHEASGRRHQPFVTISCPSLSRELLESELFGHVRGAFTGAVRDKFGKVALADGGRSSSMRSRIFRWNCSRNFFACCRSGSTSGLERPEPANVTSGSLRPQTTICWKRWGRVASGRISIIG